MNRRNFLRTITGAVASIVAAPLLRGVEVFDPVATWTHDGADLNVGFSGSTLWLWEALEANLKINNGITPEFSSGKLHISLHTGAD